MIHRTGVFILLQALHHRNTLDLVLNGSSWGTQALRYRCYIPNIALIIFSPSCGASPGITFAAGPALSTPSASLVFKIHTKQTKGSTHAKNKNLIAIANPACNPTTPISSTLDTFASVTLTTGHRFRVRKTALILKPTATNT